ncbi:hypothetical protein L1887_24269 [Cichorium endivia]|nr:hypothetical protein L1887_24269 [Cichorium endivia]
MRRLGLFIPLPITDFSYGYAASSSFEPSQSIQSSSTPADYRFKIIDFSYGYAASSSIILNAGIAEVAAGAISMGLGRRVFSEEIEGSPFGNSSLFPVTSTTFKSKMEVIPHNMLLLLSRIDSVDENGYIVCDEDGEPLIQTDGTGFIFEDLAVLVPHDFFDAKFIKDQNYEFDFVQPEIGYHGGRDVPVKDSVTNIIAS